MSRTPVKKTVAAGVLGLMGVAISLFCFGQTSTSPSRDRRLEADETDISLLKRVINEQGRRIAELEKTVKSLRAAVAAATEEPPPHELAKAIKPASERWQNPLAWAQIREGMSRMQVEEILGKPASVESVIDYQTLLYKGDVPGSGTLSGSVKLTDDRVSEIIPPPF